ncbi:hypothetical protein AQUCO_01100390v1 [Aquilegia coerulea]|uniref:Pectinesterase n=1 Tax=Aquilegia coerulea TaxID=218851 RepID=A0A2G5E6V9_AQUCA|nr:hypothetical protein AQUCO_01100390v1 [Aquilegia coerulea]
MFFLFLLPPSYWLVSSHELVVVAQDGSANFTRINDAVLYASTNSMHRYVIYIKQGIYQEYITIPKHLKNLTMVGERQDKTVISGNRSVGGNKYLTTFGTATVNVSGPGFIAQNLTIENTAGPNMAQAVALRSDSDYSAFYRCRFAGYQDTLYIHRYTQYFRECEVIGTVDFIFGSGTAVFQNCTIISRNRQNGYNTITAHSGKPGRLDLGFSFQFCTVVTADHPQTYLGRPWSIYSTTVFMQSKLGGPIGQEGWVVWNKALPVDKLYYGEFRNYGPGSNLSGRVQRAGVHNHMSPEEALKFTVSKFLNGDAWLPATGIPYTGDLGEII